MLIGVVQTRPSACAIQANIAAHETWIKRAAGRGADMLFFPELSLLGYEPKHAARLAIGADDSRLDALPVLMANCVGSCDDFEAVGGSAVWSAEGRLLARLGSTGEGALLFDSATNEVTAIGG
jgi:predicted amidohydrolase